MIALAVLTVMTLVVVGGALLERRRLPRLDVYVTFRTSGATCVDRYGVVLWHVPYGEA